ncbi:Maf family protein [Phreatobacter stygius]|uniref:Nucleoside triphosphate pyrophosphatase n=1 Tax=Phreatobacter stygius TaxID=1940610 RepID=A0A4D7BDZ3_9HYPH|nr:Maf family protein [Phreatobacter stygius]QCI69180.1 septum formation inhibitor Maf [Phreatobacter stygius]
MFVLASKSKARAAMLAGAGIRTELVAADIDERALDETWSAAGFGPAEVARLLAETKAKTVSLQMPGRIVIGADQTLALGTQRFSKPATVAAARAQLLSFRGRIHHLHSAVALARDGELTFATVTSATMHVRKFSDGFLEAYLADMGDEVLKSVGCYQFEGLGIQLFDRVEGDYFTILGMPLLPLLAALRKQDLVPS